MNPREAILSKVAPEYRVNLEEVAKDLGLRVKNGRIQLVDLSQLPAETILEIMGNTASYIEYIATIHAAVTSVIGQQKVNLASKEAQKRLEFRQQANFSRGSKSDAEDFVASDEEVVEIRKKLANYEAYAKYLKDLMDVLEKFHYTAKAALTQLNKNARMVPDGEL